MTAPTASPSTRATIGEPCAFGRAQAPAGSSPEPPRVFVELALVEGDLGTTSRQAFSSGADGTTGPAYASFAAFLNDPRFRIPTVANVLATNNVSYTIPWVPVRTDGKPGCPETDRWNLSLTPHMQPVQPNDLRLEVTLVPAPQRSTPKSSEQVPNHCRSHTTATVKDQQTIVLGGYAAHNSPTEQSMLVATPYIIWNDADLRTLLECKLRRAQKDHSGK